MALEGQLQSDGIRADDSLALTCVVSMANGSPLISGNDLCLISLFFNENLAQCGGEDFCDFADAL